ncbi:methyltransferase domain-containing protein [Verminephrobacter aporrectodeae]|uniref:methyltransferase domain-containing protein n=1 Tax=Verminephrobacter aporrectodeae TaxID=1110389 RepID=UPI002238A462|nr:methyltransferase domain-containing protein [Verminephrobacter aporrectodeae]MCW5220606.1 methyltransferase domain-containing protein [Verminephrobacter aporrectodeae subsp. tuberculatae]MCW5289901.1 methyltransferase domain-containing protein [Verminephrobacter aporrectodeae subsp. tuberculatae]MCW8177016.1 methyltransferase domain-containing protein [Verminephrobacter aporrectodeae subsp. tuberculatae]MCW8200147.1 methyltransferase domain-containing protein [Verminephrobacter aporrectodeae
MTDQINVHLDVEKAVQLVYPEPALLTVTRGRLGFYRMPAEGDEYSEEELREGVAVFGVGEKIGISAGERVIVVAMFPQTEYISVGSVEWQKNEIPADFPIVSAMRKYVKEKGYYFGYEDRYAKVYEYGAASWEPFSENASLREILARYPEAFVGDIVDLGTGEGRDSLYLLRNRIGRSVTSFDVSHSALGKARERAREEGLPVDGFIEKDIIYLRDVPPASFDVALNMGALHMLDRAEDRARHIARVFEVLRPGGYFVVDHCAANWGRGFHTIKDYDAIAADLVPGRTITRYVAIDGERKPIDLEVLHYAERSPELLLAELTAAGFEAFASLNTDTEAFGNSSLQVVLKPLKKSDAPPMADTTARERVMAAAGSLAEGAVKRDLAHELPREQVRAVMDAGFSLLRIPKEFGGDGLTIPDWGDVLIEVAAADPNVVQIFRSHIAFVEDIVHRPAGEYRDRWLRRLLDGEMVGNAWAEAGPIVQGQKNTVFIRAGDEMTVSGKKQYTTGTIFADWADVSGTYDGQGVAGFVAVHQPGVTVRDDWDGFGQRTTGTGTLILDGARVAPRDVGPMEDRIQYQTALYQWILLVVQAGIAVAVERDIAEAVRNRSRNYSHSTAALAKDDPNIQSIIGEISSLAYTARALARGVAEALQRASETGVAGRDSPEDREANMMAEIRSEQAQVIISELVPRSATLLFDALGASATSISRDLDRHWRNSRTVASHNPVAFKQRAIGDWVLNGTPPTTDWQVGTPKCEPSAT